MKTLEFLACWIFSSLRFGSVGSAVYNEHWIFQRYEYRTRKPGALKLRVRVATKAPNHS